MGGCAGVQKKRPTVLIMGQAKQLLKKQQQYMLNLIYEDLASRTSDHLINLQGFRLFFHKNGLWGQKLFKQFDYEQTNMLNCAQFMGGIAKLFKTTQKEKIRLLYSFFSDKSFKSDHGITFNNFLGMLYNYPKQDLKQIINDSDFFGQQLKSHLVSLQQNRRLDSILPSAAKAQINHNKGNPIQCRVDESSVQDVDRMPSQFSKNIIANLKKSNKEIRTSINFSYKGNDFEVKTNNIHYLVKKFTKRLFKSYNINIETGRINLEQFEEWILNHKNLYNNYYKGFHNSTWELDNKGKLKFLSIKPEKKGLGRLKIDDKLKKVNIILYHSILVLCEGEDGQDPIMTICLQGLAVKRKTYAKELGSGIQITHRDGIYSTKEIFFKNQEVTNEWMEELKCYKGQAISNLYDLGNKIGTGKFSIVYDSIQKQTGQKWAVKVIETFKLDSDAKQLIAHESSIMSVLTHPFLVAYKSTIQTKTTIYIITQLVEGKDLFEYVKENKGLDQRQVALIAYQIIIGIKYLHSLGIIHRDLKPQNVMISIATGQTTGIIKIIDFGFSNYLSSLRQFKPHDILAGTPNYIAPQILRNEVIDQKIDNFAIGAIIYFALSASLPFNGVNVPQIFQKTIDGSYEYKEKVWGTISDQAKNLIDCLLENDPQKRITLDQALKHPWLKFCSKLTKTQSKNQSNGQKKLSKKELHVF